MKRHLAIGLVLLLFLAACHGPQREARQMVRRAERLFDTDPDSTARLIDSVLRIPAYFEEGKRMDIAMLQAEALFGDRGQEIPPLMDDEFFDDKPFLSTSPDLERAAAYYADKKQYAKAAKAALYSGFVQQHYGEKTHAMRSFKDAEQYGGMAKDSLSVARAKYRMGKMLLDDGMYQDALAVLKSTDTKSCFRFAEKAMLNNLMGVCYMLIGDYENAEIYMEQALLLSKDINVKQKVLNNFAVLYRKQKKHDQALSCLKQIEEILDSNDRKLPLLYLNVGNVFSDMMELDSALFYYQILEESLPTAKLRDETMVSVYGALSRFAQLQGQVLSALHYREKHEIVLFSLMQRRQEQSVYRIQRQYDYESLQNALNQKLIRRHRISFLVGVIAILGLVALVVSQIRLARIRKQEAEAKVNLFHFMQQNDVLKQKHEEYAKLHTKLIREQTEKEKLNQDLQQKNAEYKIAYQDYAEKFSIAKNREQNIVMKLAIYLKNMGASHSLDGLKHAVFDNQTPWEAIFRIFDDLYPNVRENLLLKHPDLTESEQKDFMLSFFGVSRQDEADMLGTTVHTVDKLRNSVRKKLREASKEA